jgi:hypothetical protein
MYNCNDIYDNIYNNDSSIRQPVEKSKKIHQGKQVDKNEDDEYQIELIQNINFIDISKYNTNYHEIKNYILYILELYIKYPDIYYYDIYYIPLCAKLIDLYNLLLTHHNNFDYIIDNILDYIYEIIKYNRCILKTIEDKVIINILNYIIQVLINLYHSLYKIITSLLDFNNDDDISKLEEYINNIISNCNIQNDENKISTALDICILYFYYKSNDITLLKNIFDEIINNEFEDINTNSLILTEYIKIKNIYKNNKNNKDNKYILYHLYKIYYLKKIPKNNIPKKNILPYTKYNKDISDHKDISDDKDKPPYTKSNEDTMNKKEFFATINFFGGKNKSEYINYKYEGKVYKRKIRYEGKKKYIIINKLKIFIKK